VVRLQFELRLAQRLGLTTTFTLLQSATATTRSRSRRRATSATSVSTPPSRVSLTASRASELHRLTRSSCSSAPACSGDSSKICGGAQALMIFTTSKANATPQVLSNGWKAAQLCLLDGQNGRLFAGASTTSASMTQEVCTEFCALKGFNQAGVEYGTGACSRPRGPLLANRARAPTTDLVYFSILLSHRMLLHLGPRPRFRHPELELRHCLRRSADGSLWRRQRPLGPHQVDIQTTSGSLPTIFFHWASPFLSLSLLVSPQNLLVVSAPSLLPLPLSALFRTSQLLSGMSARCIAFRMHYSYSTAFS
jgi:hypothetical protein